MRIEVQDLNISFENHAVLQDISFDIHRGEFITILGPNGAGKSTLLKCLCGIHRRFKGSIKVGGRSLHLSTQRAWARRIGYVPQADTRYVPFTVEQFLLTSRYPWLSPFRSIREEDHKRIHSILKKTGLLPFKNREMESLSGGERQMVFIAAVMVQGPEIVLLDEPVTFLDYSHQAQVMRMLAYMHTKMKKTVITVQHDLNLASLHSTRVLGLKDGRLFFSGVAEQLQDKAMLQALYDTSFRIFRIPDHRPMIVAEGL